MNSIKRLLKSAYHLCIYLYARPFSYLFYDKKYLTGKYFSNGIYSEGWIWAAQDISYRLRSWNHLFVRFPIAPNMKVSKNVFFHPDDLNNMNSFGSYFQAFDPNSRIVIGKGTYIAPNVGIITTNHDIYNLDDHVQGKDVIIGQKCWIGMNSVILPGVELGEHTIVGAGSIVTKSFKEGHCIIAGNPARIIKELKM